MSKPIHGNKRRGNNFDQTNLGRGPRGKGGLTSTKITVTEEDYLRQGEQHRQCPFRARGRWIDRPNLT